MKKVEVLVQRTFVKEATATIEVPSNLTNQEVREYLIERYDGSQALNNLFEDFRLQNDQTTLVSVEEVEKEYKIKWDIELSAVSPMAAAKLALEMITSENSTAKIFEVDGAQIDLCEPTFEAISRDEFNNLVSETEPEPEPRVNDSRQNQVPQEVLDQLFLNGDVKGNIFTLLANGKIEFEVNYVVVNLIDYTGYIYIDKGVWRDEVAELVEVARGEFGGIYYIIDKK